MIDFQNNTITSRAPKEIINYLVIMRREETLDALRKYKLEQTGRDNENEYLLAEFSAHIRSLLEQNRSMMEKEWTDNDQYNNVIEIEKDLESDSEEQIMKAWRFIDSFLYSKGVTKTDTKENITTSNIITRNKLAGL